jgi:hypothetical protein
MSLAESEWGLRAVALSTLGLPASGVIAEESEKERDKREMRSEGEGVGWDTTRTQRHPAVS